MMIKTNAHLKNSRQGERNLAMRSKALAVAFLLVVFVAAAHAQSAPVVVSGDQRFHFTQKPGPDAVGLNVVEQYDFSRSYRSATDELGKPYHGESARPLPTLIWYPARKSGGKPMTAGGYGEPLVQLELFGPGSTIDVSAGLQPYNGTDPYPNPLIATRYGHEQQSISVPFSLGSYRLTAGHITASGTVTAAGTDGIVNAAACGTIPTPAWCAGADIGAWVNAAVASLRGIGEVYIPAGNYSQKTTMVVPRSIKLHGASGLATHITFMPTTGWALIASDGLGAGNYPEGAIEDLWLQGPGSTTPTGGIYVGGSDSSSGAPSTIFSPSGNYGDHFNINRVRVGGNSTGFGTGVQWGNNAWSDTIFESAIVANGVGMYMPTTITNTGERISIISSSIQNNINQGLLIGSDGDGVDFHLVNDSFDFNGDAPPYNWQIQNGTTAGGVGGATVEMTGCYITGAQMYIQNYGTMTIFGSTFLGGANSGALGYLIDNEFAGLTVMGGYLQNNGSGQFNNPAGVPSTWISVTPTGFLNNALITLDRATGISTIGSIGVRDNNYQSSQYQGSIACETNYAATNLSTVGSATNTNLKCLPANAIIDAVVYRITSAIATATSFTIGDSSTANRFCTTQSTVTAGTTGICFAQAGSSAERQATAAPVRVTANTTPASGAIRLIVYFHTWTPPNS
jgi:hypothetical protein